MRKKRLILNTASSLINEAVAIFAAMVIPRLIIGSYGSNVNGLIISINQFLAFFSLCEAGIGPVIRANLYKPLADQDNAGISKVIKSSQRFFRIIGVIFIAYTILLCIIYPILNAKSGEFDLEYVVTLIVILSLTTFIQYFFGITNQILLTADQRAYIHLITNSITVFINVIITAILIYFECTVHMVKLGSAIIFAFKPIIYFICVNKIYSIDKRIELKEEPIKQKWNGMVQHICTVVQDNTDTVLLTLFSSLINVSIYSVYLSIINGVKGIIFTANSSISALFGNMIAKGEHDTLNKSFISFEWISHLLSTLLFSITGVLIVPFIKVYTLGIRDANYCVPTFAYLIVICGYVRCIQLCYMTIVQSAGKFKETQNAFIAEPIINILISIFMVIKFDLIGVAIGTLISLVYRLVYLIYFVRKYLIDLSLLNTMKQFLIDFCVFISVIKVSNFFNLDVNNFISWIIVAIEVTVCSIVISTIMNICFNLKNLKNLRKKIKRNN